MKRGLLAALCSVAVWLAAMGTASAQDMGYSKTGGFGIGGAVTNRGIGGMSVYFVPAARVGVQGVLHYDTSSGDAPSSSTFGLTVNGLYSLISDGNFELPALIGLDFTNHSEDNTAGMSVSNSGAALQLGLQPAWWPTPGISLHLSLALVLDLAASNSSALSLFGLGSDPGDGTEIAFPGTAQIVGAAGVTFWIK